MRLLIIGGTSFLGRAAAEEALRRGDEVTTFNRGRSGPDVEGVEALRGDRADEGDLAVLAGRPFDVVVDTCGFVPQVVGRSVRVLQGSGAHYVFVSSISATPTWPGAPTPDGLDGQPCASDAGPEDGDYGVLKAGCERAGTGSDARLTWVEDAFLLEREVAPWTELPLWMPKGQDGDHVWDAETGAAERAGLRVRPVTDTVRDTWAWMQAGGRVPKEPPHAHLPRHGIDPDKEQRILTDWSSR